MKGTYLGEFEEIVLLVVATLEGEAYGLAVLEEIEKRSKRNVNLSAVHSSLHRLENKGFLKSSKGEATPIRGGKRKKLYEITSFGVKALSDARTLREGLWASISDVVLEKGNL